MKYHPNIESEVLANDNYRKVVDSVHNQFQLVYMSLNPNETIPRERHDIVQFFKIVDGQGKIIVGGTEYPVVAGSAVIVPPHRYHEVINTGRGKLKLYTIYTYSEHAYNAVEHRQK